jgi:hypothetical protein
MEALKTDGEIKVKYIYSEARHVDVTYIYLAQDRGQSLFFLIWFVRLLALWPLLAYCASLEC